jgi:putative glutamine amidotransferase
MSSISWADSRTRDSKPFLDDRPDFPVLGICLGMQKPERRFRRDDVQDLWSEVDGKTRVEKSSPFPADQLHKNPLPDDRLSRPQPVPYQLHKIRLSPKGASGKGDGMATDGNPYIMSSSINQAVDAFARALRAAARSMDGKFVEAVRTRKIRTAF